MLFGAASQADQIDHQLRWCAGLHRETIPLWEMFDIYATQSIQWGFDALSKSIWVEIQGIFYVWNILTLR